MVDLRQNPAGCSLREGLSLGLSSSGWYGPCIYEPAFAQDLLSRRVFSTGCVRSTVYGEGDTCGSA